MTRTLAECLWLPKSSITSEELAVLKTQHTLRPRFKNLDVLSIYSEDKDRIGLPRHSQSPLLKNFHFEDRRIFGAKIKVQFTGQLRESQIPIVQRMKEILSTGTDNDFILQAGTGSGKTVMMLDAFAFLGVPALVVVTKTDLVDQWISRALQFTDLTRDDIGIAQADRCEFEGKKLVIGMIHSLCKDKYPEEFKKYFGLVIFDETHRLGAHYFSEVAGMFPARYRFGATATLRRQDGLDRVFYDHLGTRVVRLGKAEQPDPKIIVVEYAKTSGSIPEYLTDLIQRRGVLFSKLGKNQHRSQMIAGHVNDLAHSGRQTLVLSERIPQLEYIRELLIEKYGFDPDKVGLYLSRTKKAEQKRVAEECEIILATMGMLSEATDIPTLRGLVYGTPLSDVEQSIGRICRTNSGSLGPVVVDVYDTSYPDAGLWYKKRLKFYDQKGYRHEVL